MAIIIKTPKQIAGIKKSCKIAAETLKHVSQFIQEGITTDEINKIANEFIRKNGAIPAPLNYLGFPKETCISVNEVICHGVPGPYKLKNGDIVNVDVTTILDGYYGDTATMFSVGSLSEDAQHIVKVAKKCLEIGIRQVKPGNYFGNIGFEIGRYANLQLCTVVYQYCGHGVGLQFHEDPQVVHIAPKDSGDIMKPGMVFTIEPMICLGVPEGIVDETDKWTVRTADGQLSAQFEHTVLVTKTGYEILTM